MKSKSKFIIGLVLYGALGCALSIANVNVVEHTWNFLGIMAVVLGIEYNASVE